MHDTHDVRKSKELNKGSTDEYLFRSKLIDVLERIAKALEFIESGIIHTQTRTEF